MLVMDEFVVGHVDGCSGCLGDSRLWFVEVAMIDIGLSHAFVVGGL